MPSIALLLFVFGHNLKNSEFHVLCWKLNRFGSCGSYGFYFLSKEKKNKKKWLIVLCLQMGPQPQLELLGSGWIEGVSGSEKGQGF